MNQEQNNQAPNNFNLNSINGIPNNQPLNSQNINQPQFNNQPQNESSFMQTINTFENINTNNQNLNNTPPKKKNLGLIIGIVAIIAIIGIGIFFGSKLLSNNNKINNNDNHNDSTVNENNNSETTNDVEIIYFDVVTGQKCNESDYNILNSKNGYNGINNKDNNNIFIEKETEQTSCLRFFVLNESETTKSLLLDHNTSKNIYWNAFDSTNGPGSKSQKELEDSNVISNKHNEVLYSLKEDTNNWNGTEQPKNYSYSSYEINYTDFKARLPQLEEISIAGEISNDSSFFGGELATELSKHWWLYDNLEGCLYYGCKYENTEERYDSGYWTANSSNSSKAIEVTYAAGINERQSDFTNGVRPVIEVLKSKLN